MNDKAKTPEAITDAALDTVHGGLLPAVRVLSPIVPVVQLQCQNNLKQIGIA